MIAPCLITLCSYAAPEVAARLRPDAPAYDSACDIWALGTSAVLLTALLSVMSFLSSGAILYTILSGCLPFKVPSGKISECADSS